MKKIPLLLTAITLMAIVCSCDRNKTAGGNPLLAEWDTQFGVPPFDKIKVLHYMPAFEAAMKEHNKEIKEIVNNDEAPGFDNVVLAFDNSGSMLERVSLVFFAIADADTTPEMQQVQEQILPLLSAHGDNIMLNAELFAKIKAVYDSRASLKLDKLQARLLEKTYDRFVRSGANLSPDAKEEFSKINQELAMAEFSFNRNLLEENARFQMVVGEEDVNALPAAVRNAAQSAAKEAGFGPEEYLFTIDKTSMIPFLTYCPDGGPRANLYKGYTSKGDHGDELDNKQIVNDIVRLRTRRAHLLGYPSHAEYILDDMMAKTPANVYGLLDEVWTPALKRAEQELEEMRDIRARESGLWTFLPSDWWYYAEKVRKDKYNLDQEALKPYFSLDNVRIGIFELSNRLYGITFRPVVLPVYNDEVSTYEVLDVDGTHLGILYLDMHPRPGRKSFGAWCGSFREQGFENGERVSPVVYIVCNFTRPSNNSVPALLDLDETTTFFHEFGHALHSFFSQVPYKGLLNVERDFVELPSQIMENWATQPDMLRSYAVHYATGKVIPEDFIKRIQNSATFNQGFSTVESIAASYLDMDIHTMNEYDSVDIDAFENEALTIRRGLIEQILPRYRYTYFGHIFGGGYSAGYYGYMWAEVLDKDAYEAFVETGDVFDQTTAKRFRDEVLSRGGTEDGMIMYRNFRGRQPSREPLMRARGLIE